MFKYNIDEIIYTPHISILLKGWYAGNEKLVLVINNSEEYELKRNILRQDVLDSLEDIEDKELLGFFYEVNIEKDINNVEIKKQHDNETLIKYNKEDLNLFVNKETLMFNIDSVEKLENDVRVKGWAFSKYYDDIEIELNNKLDYEIKKYDRLDVNVAYKEIRNIKNCGFEITIKNNKLSKNINLIISDKSSQKEIILDKKMLVSNNNSVVFFILKNLSLTNIKKGILYIKKYGFKGLVNKIKFKNAQSEISYSEWLSKHTPTEYELNAQKNYDFELNPLISIVVPTYNTPEKFLREMIESVINQTYNNWELCIADGSDKKETKDILEEYRNKDCRIKVRYLDKNEGISGNTNKALELVEGEYIGLFDHDDLLTLNALFEVVKVINEKDKPDFIYTDEDKVDEKGVEFFDPHFKPDFSPDTLRSYNYITHFSVFKKSLLDIVGNFRSEFDGSQDYDLILRLTEVSKNIVHIPKILYHWRVHKNSTALNIDVKPYAYISAQKAIQNHLQRVGLNGNVEDGIANGTHRVNFIINSNPLVSIIIPNKDHINDLKKCIDSIVQKSTYTNYEIIVVENNSKNKEIFEYYKEIQKNKKIKVLEWKEGFNYSAINNFAVKNSKGEYIILLNNDIEIITENWIEEMLMYCQRKDVGIVGAKLYYPDNTIQHAGVIIGLGGVAGHSHKHFHRDSTGYYNRASIAQNLSAVTAACLMVKRNIFDEVEGLDEKFKVAFNDVDFCMKVREKGYLVVFTPYAEMYHYESKSRGLEDTPEKIERFNGEIQRFEEKWGLYLEDPYYNRNLTLANEDFSLKVN